MKQFLCKIISVVLVVLLSTQVFADYKREVRYFNNLTPQNHINKLYSEERKNELRTGDIKFDDIDDMIHLYNPEILNNWNTWENNKTSNDIYDTYTEAADNLYGNASSQDSDMMEAIVRAQADAMRIQADKNSDDTYVSFLTKYLSEKQLINSTKILYIKYLKSAYDLNLAILNIEEMDRKYETAKNKKTLGEGTEIDMLKAEKNLYDAKSVLLTAESAQKAAKREVLINCGRSMYDNVNILDINIEEGTDIASINLNDDYEYALKNSIQYEIYKRRYENARTEEVKKEYKILVDNFPNTLYNSLETKYSNILDTIDTLNSRRVAYDLAVETLKQAENNYKTGNISKKELDTANYNVKVAEVNKVTALYDLKIAFIEYNNAKEGL